MNTAEMDALEVAKRHQRAGQFAAAEAIYREVLSRDPNHPQALHYLGLLMQQQGRDVEAMELIAKSVKARPDAHDFWNNLAIVQGKVGKPEEALVSLQRAIALKGDYAEAHCNRAVALETLGRHEEAIAAATRAIELRPDHAEAHATLGNLLSQQGKLQEAAGQYQKAVDAPNPSPTAMGSLGNTLRKMGQMEQAIACFQKAVELRPNSPETHNNLGTSLLDTGRLDGALVSLQKALELQPNYADAHWNLALALLTQGHFERGWLEYEWRQHLKEDTAQRRGFPQPAWNGSNIAGRTILLLSEQGLGDTIQFIRYAPLVAARGAKVIVECQPKLGPLLRSAAGVEKAIARGEPLPAFDVHARLLTLPGIFHTDAASVPAEVPYLAADTALTALWKDRLARQCPAGSVRVGIAWQGSKMYRGDATRSIALSHFEPLARLPGVCLLSLQKGEGAEQAETWTKVGRVMAPTPPLDETTGAFMDTAAVMKNLDLVVTSDTSIAHLAGALGVKTFEALGKAADWRWMRDREDTPWYPSMRLFRQREAGDWSGVFARIAEAIGELRGMSRTTTGEPVMAPVSLGELLDKMTILQIKSARLRDATAREGVGRELAALEAVRERAVAPTPGLGEMVAALRAVNERLWDVEDAIRGCDRAGDFGPRFIELARSVYHDNDERARIKARINALLGSAIIEHKQYAASE